MATIRISSLREGEITFESELESSLAADYLVRLVERGSIIGNFARSLARQHHDRLRQLSSNQLDWVQYLLWDRVDRPSTLTTQPLDELLAFFATQGTAAESPAPAPAPTLHHGSGHIVIVEPTTDGNAILGTFRRLLSITRDAANPSIRLASSLSRSNFDVRIQLPSQYRIRSARRSVSFDPGERLSRGLEINSRGRTIGRVNVDGSVVMRLRSPEATAFLRDTLVMMSAANTLAAVARDIGIHFNRCCFCGHLLTDERSTSAGYGPVCADHWGLPWGDRLAPAARAITTAQAMPGESLMGAIPVDDAPPVHFRARTQAPPVRQRHTYGNTGSLRDHEQGDGTNTDCACCSEPIPVGAPLLVQRNGFRICPDCSSE